MAKTKFLDRAGLTHLLEKTNAKFSKIGHTHTKAEIKDFAHTHDDRYYTETEIDSKLSGKAASSHKHGAADITSVNASAITGVIAAANLPSFVDDVLEGYYGPDGVFYKNRDASTGKYSNAYTGETGKIYVNINDNKTYRWSGSAYVVISDTIALGETGSTAYRGDRGKTAYNHSQITSGNPHKVTKSDVGLGSVDNTPDASKSVKYATSAGSAGAVAWANVSGKPTTFAPSDHNHNNLYYLKSEVDGKLNGKAASSHKHGAADITSVNASAITGVIAAANLPSFVDDVLEGYYGPDGVFYKNRDASTGKYSNAYTGETGKIYVNINDNKTYRWSGSAYVVISDTIALGETGSTAYRGDRGKTAYNHSQITSGNPHKVTKSDVGLGSVDNTPDASKSVKYATSAGSAGAVAWANVSGKPTTFAPSDHNHNNLYYLKSEVDGKLNGKAASSHKHGAADITSVNASAITGVIAAANLPSFVDDVLEGYYGPDGVFYKNRDASTGKYSNAYTGETGKIYVNINDNKTYRWSGSAYVVISDTIALGETGSTAYRGDRGKTAYNHSQITSGNPHKVTKSDVGLGSVDNTPDASKSVKYATSAGSAGAVAWANVSGKPTTFAPSSHNHNNLYYLKSEVDSKLNAKVYITTGTDKPTSSTSGFFYIQTN